MKYPITMVKTRLLYSFFAPDLEKEINKALREIRIKGEEQENYLKIKDIKYNLSTFGDVTKHSALIIYTYEEEYDDENDDDEHSTCCKKCT